MNNLHIDQQNFRDIRDQYGITMHDISERCGVSKSTISNFERCNYKYTDVFARPDTTKILIRALYEAIDEKLSGLFINNKHKEETEMEEKKPRYASMARKNVVDVIHSYCNLNGFTIKDFCDMCGISSSTIHAHKDHPYINLSTVNKICKVTGWPLNIFDNPEETIKKFCEDRKKNIEKATDDQIDFTAPKPIIAEVDIHIDNKEKPNRKKTNRKLYFENGVFYEEYDYMIIRHEKVTLTKDQFMAAVEEETK